MLICTENSDFIPSNVNVNGVIFNRVKLTVFGKNTNMSGL